MTENFQGLTSAQIDAAELLRKNRNNEVLKYTVAAYDRLSTAIFITGFLGPIFGSVLNPALLSNYAGIGKALMVCGLLQALMISCGLHLYGKNKLRDGWQ